MNIEIYIDSIATEDGVRWISGKMGPMVDRTVEDDITYLRSEEGVSVVVTPGIEGGSFLSIVLRGGFPGDVRSNSQERAPPKSGAVCGRGMAKKISG